MHIQTEVPPYNAILFSNKEKYVIKPQKIWRNLERILQVKEAILKILCMIPAIRRSGKGKTIKPIKKKNKTELSGLEGGGKGRDK